MIWEILLIVYILLLLWLIFNIIIDYDNRNPVKTISWIFTIVFIPLIGMFAYYVLGRNIRKKRLKTKKLMDQFNRQHKRAFEFDENNPEYSNYTELQRLIYQMERVPVLSGNRIEVYPGGKIKFKHLLKDIDEAKDHIHIFYFTIGDDKISCQLKEMLIKKVYEGITVRLIYDGLGSSTTNRQYFRQMKDAGIDVRTFLPLSFPRIIHSINYRNHRKIVIIDGKIAYTGGINVKDEYVNGLEWGKWNDIHFKIEGQGTLALQSVFLADWYYVAGECLPSDKFYPVLDPVGKSPVQIVNGEPFGLHSNILEAMFVAISRAKKCVYIETPYFIPTANLLSVIQTAVIGIDVRLIIPGRSDSGRVQYASNTYVESLLRNNVKVYQYADGFTHSKLMVIDDELVIAGSSNLDIRSLELHFETNIFIYDRNVAQMVEDVFFKDIADSKEVHLNQWINRSKRTKFKEVCFRLLSPVF